VLRIAIILIAISTLIQAIIFVDDIRSESYIAVPKRSVEVVPQEGESVEDIIARIEGFKFNPSIAYSYRDHLRFVSLMCSMMGVTILFEVVSKKSRDKANA